MFWKTRASESTPILRSFRIRSMHWHDTGKRWKAAGHNRNIKGAFGSFYQTSRLGWKELEGGLKECKKLALKLAKDEAQPEASSSETQL
jgi:hypothetical protein